MIQLQVQGLLYWPKAFGYGFKVCCIGPEAFGYGSKVCCIGWRPSVMGPRCAVLARGLRLWVQGLLYWSEAFDYGSKVCCIGWRPSVMGPRSAVLARGLRLWVQVLLYWLEAFGYGYKVRCIGPRPSVIFRTFAVLAFGYGSKVSCTGQRPSVMGPKSAYCLLAQGLRLQVQLLLAWASGQYSRPRTCNWANMKLLDKWQFHYLNRKKNWTRRIQKNLANMSDSGRVFLYWSSLSILAQFDIVMM